ncbi:MAG: ABC transporter substrate-binding protein [Nitrospinae bacterium]|nr:ABC transporter substrate-binding protein [Nitrospinota bacterium]MBL7020439.1 ABC transporter substrate-binding protein [Nitrospinaceae bacterium]
MFPPFYFIKTGCKILRIISVLFLLVFLPASSLLWAGDAETRSANRIISSSPSITETLFALGLGHRVVGVTDFCEYPPEACQLPSIGGMTNPHMEALVTLQPDLALHLSHSAQMERNTKTLGIPSMAMKMDTLDDILNSIKLLGSTLGDEKGSEQLLKKLTEGINFYKNKLKDIPPKETLLLLGDSSDPGRDLYATGPGTFLHELLEISGGKNILHDSMAKYPRLTKEYVIEKSPEVIIEAGPKSRLTPEQIKERLRGWKRFPSIRAVQTGQVHYIGADYILIPGPRLLSILERFSKVLHPDIFHNSFHSKRTKEEEAP